MKRISLVLFLSVFLAAFLATSALAQEAILQGIRQQHVRIDDGLRSGSLNQNEAEMLRGNLDYIGNSYEKARRDGLLTKREEQRLWKMLRQNGGMIYKKKTNPIRRFY